MTNFPCKDCIINITRIRYEISPILIYEISLILILRVANVPYDKAIIVDWLFERYRAGITVELHAINVVEELGRVNCRQHASSEEKQQWKKVKERRKKYDDEADEKVKQITEEIMNRMLEHMQITDRHNS